MGYPTVVVLKSGKVLCLYHEWSEEDSPIHIIMGTTFDIAS